MQMASGCMPGMDCTHVKTTEAIQARRLIFVQV